MSAVQGVLAWLADPAHWTGPDGIPTRLLEHVSISFAAVEREGGYDLAHANFFMSGVVAAELKKTLGIPYVMTFHALGLVRRFHQGDADEFPAERVDIERRMSQYVRMLSF